MTEFNYVSDVDINRSYKVSLKNSITQAYFMEGKKRFLRNTSIMNNSSFFDKFFGIAGMKAPHICDTEPKIDGACHIVSFILLYAMTSRTGFVGGTFSPVIISRSIMHINIDARISEKAQTFDV